MEKLNLETRKGTFHRNGGGMSRLQIPDAILNGKLLDDAVYESEQRMKYIIDKYGLYNFIQKRD